MRAGFISSGSECPDVWLSYLLEPWWRLEVAVQQTVVKFVWSLTLTLSFYAYPKRISHLGGAKKKCNPMLTFLKMYLHSPEERTFCCSLFLFYENCLGNISVFQRGWNNQYMKEHLLSFLSIVETLKSRTKQHLCEMNIFGFHTIWRQQLRLKQ